MGAYFEFGYFDTVHSVEVRYEGMGVVFGVAVVLWEDCVEEVFFFACLGFDHVSSVVAVEEELLVLGWCVWVV